ncbi:unnamed protein product [Meganyctiphanes norvegica]|uniref:Maturase K n=1 Tax=Meganyctiphanes norvegica TaxID=48144 RepID=A0AAV2QBE8_MEGNR
MKNVLRKYIAIYFWPQGSFRFLLLAPRASKRLKFLLLATVKGLRFPSYVPFLNVRQYKGIYCWPKESARFVFSYMKNVLREYIHILLTSRPSKRLKSLILATVKELSFPSYLPFSYMKNVLREYLVTILCYFCPSFFLLELHCAPQDCCCCRRACRGPAKTWLNIKNHEHFSFHT